jgi:hypothetical protein
MTEKPRTGVTQEHRDLTAALLLAWGKGPDWPKAPILQRELSDGCRLSAYGQSDRIRLYVVRRDRWAEYFVTPQALEMAAPFGIVVAHVLRECHRMMDAVTPPP